MVAVEMQPRSPGHKPPPVTENLTVPTETELQSRRRSRLMSTSSVMSAAAVGVATADEHSISNNEALVHLIKATIGGGFLAMPEAFHNTGWLIGVVGTILLGLAVLNMMATIVRCSHRLRSGKYAVAVLAEQNNANPTGDDQRDDNGRLPPARLRARELLLPSMDFPDTVEGVFKRGARGRFARCAPFFKYFTSSLLVATYYGVNIIYVCIVAGTFKQLVDQYTVNGTENSWAQLLHGRSIRWYPILTLFLIIPVGMVRLIKFLVPFSIAANACLVAGVSVVFYFIFAHDNGLNPLRPEERAKMVVWPVTRWSLFTGSTLCSLEGVGMLLHIENAMSRPLELVGPPAYTLHKSMFFIVLLNGALGLCGYLRYGDQCAGSISLNLPPNNRLSEMIKILVAVGILLTYGLQLTVTMDLAWQKLRRWLVKDTETENMPENEEELTLKLTVYYYGLRFVLILGTVIVATAVPEIGPLVSLVGAVGFSLLGLIIPCIMETVWYWYPKEDEDEDLDQDGSRDDRMEVAARVDGTSTTANGNGKTGLATVAAVEEAPGAMVTDRTKETTGHRRRLVRRAIRHVKNASLFLLGMCALLGGAFYNVRDIIALASDL